MAGVGRQTGRSGRSCGRRQQTGPEGSTGAGPKLGRPYPVANRTHWIAYGGFASPRWGLLDGVPMTETRQSAQLQQKNSSQTRAESFGLSWHEAKNVLRRRPLP